MSYLSNELNLELPESADETMIVNSENRSILRFSREISRCRGEAIVLPFDSSLPVARWFFVSFGASPAPPGS